MELHIIEKTDDFKHVALAGRLDTRGVDEIETKFNAVVGTKAKAVLIDFSEVTFLSSMGIRLLITAGRNVARNGGKLAILAPQELVREAIENASLDQIVEIAETESEAKSTLGVA